MAMTVEGGREEREALAGMLQATAGHLSRAHVAALFDDGYAAWVWLTTPLPPLGGGGRRRSRWWRMARSNLWPMPLGETCKAISGDSRLRLGSAQSRSAWCSFTAYVE